MTRGAELTEEGNSGGASAQIQRGWRRFSALDRCTGFAEGEEGVPVSFGAEHGRGTERRDGGRVDRREEKWGGVARAAPRRGRRGEA
jgi:hypothetical protein